MFGFYGIFIFICFPQGLQFFQLRLSNLIYYKNILNTTIYTNLKKLFSYKGIRTNNGLEQSIVNKIFVLFQEVKLVFNLKYAFFTLDSIWESLFSILVLLELMSSNSLTKPSVFFCTIDTFEVRSDAVDSNFPSLSSTLEMFPKTLPLIFFTSSPVNGNKSFSSYDQPWVLKKPATKEATLNLFKLFQ